MRIGLKWLSIWVNSWCYCWTCNCVVCQFVVTQLTACQWSTVTCPSVLDCSWHGVNVSVTSWSSDVSLYPYVVLPTLNLFHFVDVECSAVCSQIQNTSEEHTASIFKAGWRHRATPKRWYLSKISHGFTTQNAITAVGTSSHAIQFPSDTVLGSQKESYLHLPSRKQI
jgi:hypothetical protein